MPRLGDVKAVRRFFGFINYVATFLARLSDAKEPLRQFSKHGLTGMLCFMIID